MYVQQRWVPCRVEAFEKSTAMAMTYGVVSNMVLMLWGKGMSAVKVDDPDWKATWSVKPRWSSGNCSEVYRKSCTTIHLSVLSMWLKLAGNRTVYSALRPWPLADCSRYPIVSERLTNSMACLSRLPKDLQTHVHQSGGTMLEFNLLLLQFDAGCLGCWTFAILMEVAVADWLTSWHPVQCVTGHLRWQRSDDSTCLLWQHVIGLSVRLLDCVYWTSVPWTTLTQCRCWKRLYRLMFLP